MNHMLLEECNKLSKDSSSSYYHLASWHLSDVYHLQWWKKEYIIKVAKKNITGYEYDFDIEHSYQISHMMYQINHQYNKIRSYGYGRYNWYYYHLQDYIIWSIKNILQYSVSDIKAVAKHIASIHKQPYSWNQNPYLIYRRSIRDSISNTQSLLPQYEAMTLQSTDSSWFSTMIQSTVAQYMKIMKWDRNRPCVHLHGDFNTNNIIIWWNNTISLIDFSDIPYGEPWIDIGIFLTEMEIAYTLQKKDYTSMKNIFLETYISYTHDKYIEQYINLSRTTMIAKLFAPHVQDLLWRDRETYKSIKNLITI